MIEQTFELCGYYEYGKCLCSRPEAVKVFGNHCVATPTGEEKQAPPLKQLNPETVESIIKLQKFFCPTIYQLSDRWLIRF